MCGRSPGDWRGGGAEFTISALVQKTLLQCISPRFLSVSSRGSGSSRRCRRFQTVGSAHLPGSETLAQVEATVLSPVHETLPPAVPFAGLLGKRISPCLAHPAKVQECLSPSRTESRQSQGATGRTRRTGRTGERERTHTGTLRQGCLEVPSQA